MNLTPNPRRTVLYSIVVLIVIADLQNLVLYLPMICFIGMNLCGWIRNSGNLMNKELREQWLVPAESLYIIAFYQGAGKMTEHQNLVCYYPHCIWWYIFPTIFMTWIVQYLDFVLKFMHSCLPAKILHSCHVELLKYCLSGAVSHVCYNAETLYCFLMMWKF